MWNSDFESLEELVAWLWDMEDAIRKSSLRSNKADGFSPAPIADISGCPPCEMD